MTARRAHPVAGIDPAGLDAAMHVLAAVWAPYLAPHLAEFLRASGATDPDPWDLSPLGSRKTRDAARRGELEARRVGRQWFVKRSSLEAFMASRAPTPRQAVDDTRAANDASEPTSDEVLAEILPPRRERLIETGGKRRAGGEAR